MQKVITYSFSDNFIEKVGEFIERNFLDKKRDLSRIAIVFGGKRPSLFLKRELSRRLTGSFFPPVFFSMDEFVEYMLTKKKDFRRISEIDACYRIYKLSHKILPDILKGREDFARFLPWAREILSFIELLDLEDIEPEALKNVEANAAIGYEVPEGINRLLKNIAGMRGAYHGFLKEGALFSRGLMYLTVSNELNDIEIDEFDRILFCNFFYLHKTEGNIIKHLYETDRAILIFQGSENEWPVLKKIFRRFSSAIKPEKDFTKKYNLYLYEGNDIHTEVCLAREIIKNIKNLDSTVIVLPDPESLIPLLSEITYLVKEFNVSMGYPLKRSPVYTLLGHIFRSQETKKESGYYTPDYLKAISHPFIKNLKIGKDPSITRVLIHKIEEILSGRQVSGLSGSIFVKLVDIEKLPELYLLSASTLKNMGYEVTQKELKDILGYIHGILFYVWEKIKNFKDFSSVLGKFLDELIEKGPLGGYPINFKIIEKLYLLKEELQAAGFIDEPFPKEDIFKIFMRDMENQLIPFLGSPIKGLQILGLFETRALSFRNVIVLDVNDSVLPKLNIYEPLIPREVVLSLGLNRLEEEEEIQRYHFLRLINSSQNIYLIYTKSDDRERSRFIEELIWEREKEAQMLDIVPVVKGSFEVRILSGEQKVFKVDKELEFLRRMKFSPTAVNTYITCPLSYYYQYVLGLKEKEDFLEEPEGLHIGKFVHSLLEETFKRFEGRHPLIDKDFRKSFMDIFFTRFDEFFLKRMKEDSFLLKEVLRYRLEKFLDKEEGRGVEEIVCLEREFESAIKIKAGTIKIISRIDRIDRFKDGSLCIIDYKTGGELFVPKDIKKLEKMEFARRSIGDIVRSFQLPLYIYLASETYRDSNIKSSLYSLKDLGMVNFPKEKEGHSLKQILGICMEAFEFIAGEILDPDVPFTADRDAAYCKNCPFFYMCR